LFGAGRAGSGGPRVPSGQAVKGGPTDGASTEMDVVVDLIESTTTAIADRV
jgi:hypothetical protein